MKKKSFKIPAKEIRGYRNVVPKENAVNIKAIKWKKTVRITYKKQTQQITHQFSKRQDILVNSVMRREKLEHLTTTEMIERKQNTD